VLVKARKETIHILLWVLPFMVAKHHIPHEDSKVRKYAFTIEKDFKMYWVQKHKVLLESSWTTIVITTSVKDDEGEVKVTLPQAY
jgi:hypothetical protein